MSNSILIVEDSWLLAEVMEHEVRSLGVDVAGPTSNLDEAINLGQTAPLLGALLDIEVQRKAVFPLCEILEGRRVPFVFVSGRCSTQLPARWQAKEILTKPFTQPELRGVVRHFLDSHARQLSLGQSP